MPVRPKTNLLRRLILESGEQQDISQSSVAGSVVETLTPVLEQALAGEPTVPVPPTDYWFTATETSPDSSDHGLRAEFGKASAGSAPLAEMTLKPPDADGAPAFLMTSIGGWLQAVASGSLGPRPAADRIALEIADLETCIAWTWLELHGYAIRLQNLGSPLEVLFSAGGGMLTAIVEEPGQSPEVCFLVLNTPDAVRRLPEIPGVEVHARLFKIGPVHLVPLVAQIGDTWYESWINACSDDGRGIEELEILAAQDRIVFLVYDGTSFDPERTVQLANPLAESVAQMRRVMQNVPPWTTEEFADAREELYAAYPTPQDLIFGPDLTAP
ncbi:MAG: hypothetical protein OXI54_03200 [Chloroflexota bacterium]|nr:hypothetical protein [Chloroflexota bacterium]MDE2683140.1 hypothetical protein [Chloroflexota bacterium]